jgi:hypothetical protein
MVLNGSSWKVSVRLVIGRSSVRIRPRAPKQQVKSYQANRANFGGFGGGNLRPGRTPLHPQTGTSGGVVRRRRVVRFARLIGRCVGAFVRTCGPRRLRRQSQADPVATRGDIPGAAPCAAAGSSIAGSKDAGNRGGQRSSAGRRVPPRHPAQPLQLSWLNMSLPLAVVSGTCRTRRPGEKPVVQGRAGGRALGSLAVPDRARQARPPGEYGEGAMRLRPGRARLRGGLVGAW